MNNPCQFVAEGQVDGAEVKLRCVRCGRLVKTEQRFVGKVFAQCRTPAAGSPDAAGPGTELKALLRDWLGFVASPECSCNAMARKMNALGTDWCESEAGMAEILGVMRAEHTKRWIFGKTKLPWTDYGATKLVQLACRRARAKASA